MHNVTFINCLAQTDSIQSTKKLKLFDLQTEIKSCDYLRHF